MCVKNKVFQPSNGFRHRAKTTQLIRANYSEDSMQSDFPILIEISDGGPDHRTTYASVQVSHICKFIQLDLVLLVAVRTAPMGKLGRVSQLNLEPSTAKRVFGM